MKNRKKVKGTAEKKRASVKRFLSILNKPLFATKEKEFILENLAMLISSGRGIVLSLQSIALDIKSKSLKKTIEVMAQDIEGGTPMSKAAQKTGIFGKQTISLIATGEKSGRLASNMTVIVEHSRKKRSFKSKMRSAMMYPIFVMVLTSLVGLVVAWFVLPNLAQVFSNLDIDLPLITQILIAVGLFLNEHGVVLIPTLAAFGVLTVWLVFFFSHTKFIGQWILLHIPAVRTILQHIELSRMGFLAGSLLKAGLSLVETLNALSDASELRVYKTFYAAAGSAIERGDTFSQLFEQYKRAQKLIPKPVQEMIIAAEQSGRLAEAFLNIGHIYEQKSDNASKNMAVLLEPMLLVVVWAGVMLVALAVVLPIYSLVGNLNTTQEPSTSPQTQETARVPDPDPPADLVEILPTGLGYLNVRAQASTNAQQLLRVSPGDTYVLLETANGWLKIQVGEVQGWISETYAKKL